MTASRARSRTIYTHCLRCGAAARPDLKIHSSGSCRVCTAAYMRGWRARNKERLAPKNAESQRRAAWKLRVEVVAAYGGRCACCGEARPEFLTLDRIDGAGATPRRQRSAGGGSSLYRWARKNGHPPSLRVLCCNCHSAIAQYGYCPHVMPASQPLPNRDRSTAV